MVREEPCTPYPVMTAQHSSAQWTGSEYRAADSQRVSLWGQGEWIYIEEYQNTAKRPLCHTKHWPQVAVICGSGLGGVANQLIHAQIFNYSEKPDFTQSTVPVKCPCVWIPKWQILCDDAGGSCGDEGHPLMKVTLPVGVFCLPGVDTPVTTNAAPNSRLEIPCWSVITSAYMVSAVRALSEGLIMKGLAFVSLSCLRPMTGRWGRNKQGSRETFSKACMWQGQAPPMRLWWSLTCCRSWGQMLLPEPTTGSLSCKALWTSSLWFLPHH